MIFPMFDLGALTKLRIEAFGKPDYSGGRVGLFLAYVNPTELTSSYTVTYDSAQGAGTTNARMEFKRVTPGDLTINFFLDGTGANGKTIDVETKIQQFKEVTGYSGDIHRPRYLQIAWGTLEVRKCVLKSASIAYKLFTANGVPLRAVITAVFTSNSDDKTRVAEEKASSPDLTHARIVKAGDTLPMMCYEIYNDPGYYLKVAQANRLDNFRNLVPGTRIFFPPLEK